MSDSEKLQHRSSGSKQTRKRHHSEESSEQPGEISIVDKVVDVFALLSALNTALEFFKLESPESPKIDKLLSEAVALRRVSPNSEEFIMTQVMTADNRQFISVINEKLKSLLEVGEMSSNRCIAVATAIEKIERLKQDMPAIISVFPVNTADQNIVECNTFNQNVVEYEFDESDKNLADDEKNSRRSKFEFINDVSDSIVYSHLNDFSNLKLEEQVELIQFLAQMEEKDPTRVEALREFAASQSI